MICHHDFGQKKNQNILKKFQDKEKGLRVVVQKINLKKELNIHGEKIANGSIPL